VIISSVRRGWIIGEYGVGSPEVTGMYCRYG
jgi:hypothetical protein